MTSKESYSEKIHSEKAPDFKNDSDAESVREDSSNGPRKEVKLVRQLKNRHVAMIRFVKIFPTSVTSSYTVLVLVVLLEQVCFLGSIIYKVLNDSGGLGLFLGTATGLRNGGPVGMSSRLLL